MNQSKKIFILSSIILIGFAGCGVKGKPLPPEVPVPIGRGQGAAPVVESEKPALPSKAPAPTPKIIPETTENTKKRPAKTKIKQ